LDEQIYLGIMAALSVGNILLTFAGVFLGILFGAVPGLTAVMAITLLLPFSFALNCVSSMCLFMGIYLGGVSGGLISAITLNIPGAPGSVATTFDGYPMAEKGEAGRALAAGIIYSFLGGEISIFVLMLVAPQLAEIAVKITPFDYFSLIFFSLIMMSGVLGKSFFKGILAAMLGLIFSFIGADPTNGVPRFTFGMHELDGGFLFFPVMIGVFAMTEVLQTAEDCRLKNVSTRITQEVTNVRISFKDFKEQVGNFIWSCLIGIGIGILPGIGGGTANIVSYMFAKNHSKYPEKFGTGILDGVVASETTNNASIGGAMVPLLSIGIPGDAVTAILLGAFMMHGIVPGPLMFITQVKLIYAIFTAMLVANFFMIATEFIFLKAFIKVLNVPKHILIPVILAFCIIGAYGTNNRIFDIYVSLFFGVVGFTLKKFKYPLPPMIIAFILGPYLEINLRRALIYSKGSVIPFFTNPLSGFLLVISFVFLGFTVYKGFKKS